MHARQCARRRQHRRTARAAWHARGGGHITLETVEPWRRLSSSSSSSAPAGAARRRGPPRGRWRRAGGRR
eukprot:2621881-Rhodomonas_salina.1